MKQGGGYSEVFFLAQIGNCPLHEAVSTNRAPNGTVTTLLAAPGGSSVVNRANKVSSLSFCSKLQLMNGICGFIP